MASIYKRVVNSMFGVIISSNARKSRSNKDYVNKALANVGETSPFIVGFKLGYIGNVIQRDLALGHLTVDEAREAENYRFEQAKEKLN